MSGDLSLYLEDHHVMMREMVREFAETEIAPVAAYHDEHEEFPWKNAAKMAELGLFGIPFEDRYGGADMDLLASVIASEELARIDASHSITIGAHISLACTPIHRWGTEEQKQKYLTPMAGGQVLGGFGLTEPNAGSDAGGTETTAVRKGDHYVLNGQKTWTTYAQYADWIFLLCRTGFEGRKQEGITFLLADIRNTEGITVKPFLTTGGTLAFAETWFKDARVPQSNRVGPEDGGWAMAKALLGHERTLIGGVAESGRWIGFAKRIARDARVGTGSLLDDLSFRRRIARLEMRHRALAMVNYRNLAAAQLGRAPGAESSILKIVGTETQQEATELAMDAMGHDALGWLDSPPEALPEHEQAVASEFNYLRAATIYGGSNEIQKNIISKVILRLPNA